MAALMKAQRPAIGDLKMFVGSDDELARQERLGWAVADGTNGTLNFIDNFPKFDTAVKRGNTGGSKSIVPAGSVVVSVSNHTLSQAQMPSHSHIETVRKPSGSNISDGTTGISKGTVVATSPTGSSGSHGHGGSGSFLGFLHSNEPQHTNVLPLQFIGRTA